MGGGSGRMGTTGGLGGASEVCRSLGRLGHVTKHRIEATCLESRGV